MGEEIDKRRIDIVMRQLYLVEMEFAGGCGLSDFETQYAYALSRHRVYHRLYNQAYRLLVALNESQPKPVKGDLTGDALWKSIEDACKQ